MRTDAQRARHAAAQRRYYWRRKAEEWDLGDPGWGELWRWTKGLVVAGFVYAASNGFWLVKP